MLSCMSDFEPWSKYPDLSRERLSALANIIRRVRREAVALHQAQNGDNEWSLGCRVYVRTCHALTQAAKEYPWLTILPEPEKLSFSFAVGTIPFRFYRGAADDPPGRYLITTPGENHHQQLCLAIEGFRPIDKILRMAVEVDDTTREVSAVTVVEVDDADNVIGTFGIPFDAQPSTVTPIQAKPVDLPPPTVEPLRPTGEEQKKVR